MFIPNVRTPLIEMIKDIEDFYGESNQMFLDFCKLVGNYDFTDEYYERIESSYNALMEQDYDYEECNDEVGFNPYLGCCDYDC